MGTDQLLVPPGLSNLAKIGGDSLICGWTPPPLSPLAKGGIEGGSRGIERECSVQPSAEFAGGEKVRVRKIQANADALLRGDLGGRRDPGHQGLALGSG